MQVPNLWALKYDNKIYLNKIKYTVFVNLHMRNNQARIHLIPGNKFRQQVDS